MHACTLGAVGTASGVSKEALTADKEKPTGQGTG